MFDMCVYIHIQIGTVKSLSFRIHDAADLPNGGIVLLGFRVLGFRV